VELGKTCIWCDVSETVKVTDIVSGDDSSRLVEVGESVFGRLLSVDDAGGAALSIVYVVLLFCITRASL
jgi:hypothetical protein